MKKFKKAVIKQGACGSIKIERCIVKTGGPDLIGVNISQDGEGVWISRGNVFELIKVLQKYTEEKP
jgi:hypothetical protein